MSLPKEPRQLMINIMYLVLTALLALNVSAEILKAFSEANVALEENNFQMKHRLDKSYEMFREKVKRNQGQGSNLLATSVSTSELLQVSYDQIESMKNELIEYSGGYISIKDPETGEEIITDQLKYADNKEKPTRFFLKGYQERSLTDEPGDQREARGAELKSILREARQSLLDASPTEEVRVQMEELISIPNLDLDLDSLESIDSEYDSWTKEQFYQLPTIAAISILSRFQNEIRNSESVFVEKLSNMVNKDNVIFDRFDAAVIPNGTKFFPGDKLILQSFLTASASSSAPQISFNGSSYNTNGEGRAIYEKVLNSIGKKSIDILVKSRNSLGQMKTYTKTFEYEVVPPPDHMAVASADATKVLYIGLDNPISAGISGIPDNQVRVTMVGGDLSSTSSGKFKARVESPGIAELIVSGPKADGSGDYTERINFRKEKIPDPIAIIGLDPDNNRGGNMRTGVFRAQEGIKAQLKNFLFDVNFEVISYKVTYAPEKDLLRPEYQNNGERFSSRVKSWQKEAAAGDKFFFDDIKARGPDGLIRDLGSLAYIIR